MYICRRHIIHFPIIQTGKTLTHDKGKNGYQNFFLILNSDRFVLIVSSFLKVVNIRCCGTEL